MTFCSHPFPRRLSFSRKPDTPTLRRSRTPYSSSVYPPNSPSSSTLAPTPIRISTSTTSWACTPRIVPGGLILGTSLSGRFSERVRAQTKTQSCWLMLEAAKATTLSSSKSCITTFPDDWSCRICRTLFNKRAHSLQVSRPRRMTFSSLSLSKVCNSSYPSSHQNEELPERIAKTNPIPPSFS